VTTLLRFGEEPLLIVLAAQALLGGAVKITNTFILEGIFANFTTWVN
jgi:hypothetical protein